MVYILRHMNILNQIFEIFFCSHKKCLVFCFCFFFYFNFISQATKGDVLFIFLKERTNKRRILSVTFFFCQIWRLYFCPTWNMHVMFLCSLLQSCIQLWFCNISRSDICTLDELWISKNKKGDKSGDIKPWNWIWVEPAEK